ncbi:hypothetical protein [Nocardia otitidiscaviarum]|uniref:hypothetical protein n=1 Tax=Nocardia otitidiscaviarum TaxID=1823 RepID=UPI000A75494C|nr:hypothetical protein [Nocardia otitidiscaviarum]
MKRTIRYLTAATFLGAGVAVAAAPANAEHPGSPCQLGWSNVEPRSCEQNSFNLAPTWTLGNGICAGMFTTGGTAFDGPLYEYSEAPGATHAIVLRITQGFSPVGYWGPQFLACDVTAVVDWHNIDTGQSGSVSQFVPAGQRSTPAILVAHTGPGRVQLTVRTDRPSIPATAEVFVP